MRKVSIILLALFVVSCAKVSVETKNPIKVDITMRVDVYQHVVKDVEDINDQIYGNLEKDFNFLFSFQDAYAAELSAGASAAISRRKNRVSTVEKFFAQGYIGENKNGLLEVRGSVPGGEKARVEKLISEENKDREILYKAIAKKNGTDVSSVRKASFESDYKRASSGYWFQVSGGWKKK